MATEHCCKCNSDAPCGEGHLYVLELGLGIDNRYSQQSKRGVVYVGSTGKSVEQRFQDNLTRRDGSVVPVVEARNREEDGKWKYNTPGTKLIRKHYVKHRPDLLYFDQNPISLNILKDPGRLKRRETRLAVRLRNRGWKVLGDHNLDL